MLVISEILEVDHRGISGVTMICESVFEVIQSFLCVIYLFPNK